MPAPTTRSPIERKLLTALSTLLIGTQLTGMSLAEQDTKWSTIPQPSTQDSTEPQAYVVTKPASPAVLGEAARQAFQSSSFASSSSSAAPATLPLWFYNVVSSRDHNGYFGIMIGKDPFNGGGSASVSTYIIPIALKINQIGVSYNPATRVITAAPGVATFDPSAPDTTCLTAPNNVPSTVLAQSPIFNDAHFTFGGTSVGKTQYIDAFQRASFWKALDDDRGRYHVLLNPVTKLPSILIDVPAPFGVTRPASSTVRTTCGPEAIVDIYWLDTYLSSVVIPALAPKGVNSGSFPIFQLYNTVMSTFPTNLGFCCILGYHGANGPPIQTYSVSDYDTSNFFAAGLQDTGILSHEVGEWANDPFVFNLVPLWGHTGQVGGCQSNLEVGDPLTGALSTSTTMSNGYTYHLQEMAFYSWFIGKPSVGVNGWYSNNASFLTDAGPTCH